MNLRPRLAALVAGAVSLSGLALGFTAPAHAAVGPDLQITEIAYGGKADKAPGSYAEGDGEYIEVTNVGDAPQSLAGWSYAANKSTVTPTVGVVDLSSLGTIAPGESFLITDLTPDHFRAEWGLKSSVKVINDGTQTINGGPDKVGIFNGPTPVDSLGYASGFLSAKGVAAFVNPGHLADTDTAVSGAWTSPATTTDVEGSWTSAVGSTGSVGSPGASTRGTSTPDTVRAGAMPPVDPPTPPAIDPNWADISINEVSSDNAVVVAGVTLRDPVELYNRGTHDVSVAGWQTADSGHLSALADLGPLYINGASAPASSPVIPAGGFAVLHSPNGLSGEGDDIQLYLPDATLVSTLTYPTSVAGTDNGGVYTSVAACPDGSTTYLRVKAASFGASNASACTTGEALDGDVPPASDVPCTTEAPGATTNPVAGAATWPGGSSATVADDVCAWVGGGTEQDLSGLVFDPTDPSILWAVKNKSVVFKLAKTGGVWRKVTTGGWAQGKAIAFPSGTGLPDSEGITVGPDGALYVTTERDNNSKDVPLDSILRIDPSGSSATLTATDQWILTGDLGFAADDAADSNLGFEGVTYVPDSYLTAHGFIDDSTHAPYTPSTYPSKKTTGLFFAAVEKTGHLRAYALNTDHTFTRVADIATGMAGVMDVGYDADLHRIWAQCDNTCGVNLALLAIGADGHITPERQFARPAGLPDNNLEGFAVAPLSTAVDGKREVVWSDDGNYGTSSTGVSTLAANGGHSLWTGTMDVALGLPQTVTFTSTAPASAVLGGTYAPTTTSTGGDGAVVLGATGSCTISGGVVAFTHAGVCTVTADKAAGTAFAAAPQATQTITVGKAAQTVTFTSSAPTGAKAGGPAYTPSAAGGASGLPVTFTAVGACAISAGVVSFTTAGTCTVIADQAGNADYVAATQQTQSFAVAAADLVPPAPQLTKEQQKVAKAAAKVVRTSAVITVVKAQLKAAKKAGRKAAAKRLAKKLAKTQKQLKSQKKALAKAKAAAKKAAKKRRR